MLVYLSAAKKKSLKNKNLEDIELQQADIVIGTHALFESNVVFKNLGLVIIDEQHRFGVVQRAKTAKQREHTGCNCDDCHTQFQELYR